MNKQQINRANAKLRKWNNKRSKNKKEQKKGKVKKSFSSLNYSPLSKPKQFKQCIKCGISNKQIHSAYLHRHHIIYEPEEIVILCQQCHFIITKVNQYFSKFAKRKLSNEDRYEMWDYFMNIVPLSMNDKTLKSFMVHHEYFKRWGQDRLPYTMTMLKSV